jgi:hypothetical protein
MSLSGEARRHRARGTECIGAAATPGWNVVFIRPAPSIPHPLSELIAEAGAARETG